MSVSVDRYSLSASPQMYKNYQMRKVKVVAARKKAKILSSFVPSNSNDRSRLITDVGRAKPLMNVNGTIEETMAVQLTERPESLIFGTETELNVEHIASQKSIDDQKLGVTEASVVDFAALQQRAHDYEPKDDLIVHSTSPNTELSPTLATEIGPNIKRPEFIAVQIEEIEGDKKNEYQKQRECEDKMQKESDIVLERHQNDKKDEDLAAPVPIEHRPLTETQLELIPPMDYFPSDQNVKTRERDYDGWNFVRQNLNLIIQLGET